MKCSRRLSEISDFRFEISDLRANTKNKAQKSILSHPLIIAIDGPSGAGKSTLGRMLARSLNLLYIDTGSMYRAVALAVMESSVNAQDDIAVGSLAGRVDIDLAGDPDSLRVTLEGRDVT